VRGVPDYQYEKKKTERYLWEAHFFVVTLAGTKVGPDQLGSLI